MGRDWESNGEYSRVKYTDITLLGAGLKPSKQNCVIIGRYNDPSPYDNFEIGNGTADNARSNIFAVANDPLDGPMMILDGIQLTKADLIALLALIWSSQ